jgi:hypothetical protein
MGNKRDKNQLLFSAKLSHFSAFIWISWALLFAPFTLPISSWAACSGSNPNWSSTADYASVNSCVSRASAGDTITVSGNATWTDTLTITRGVNLIASGNPVITKKRLAINWHPSAGVQAAHVSVKMARRFNNCR